MTPGARVRRPLSTRQLAILCSVLTDGEIRRSWLTTARSLAKRGLITLDEPRDPITEDTAFARLTNAGRKVLAEMAEVPS